MNQERLASGEKSIAAPRKKPPDPLRRRRALHNPDSSLTLRMTIVLRLVILKNKATKNPGFPEKSHLRKALSEKGGHAVLPLMVRLFESFRVMQSSR